MPLLHVREASQYRPIRRKAFETPGPFEEATLRCEVDIVDSAERHLRLEIIRDNPRHDTKVDIVDSAERHLRLAVDKVVLAHELHEVDIVNSAERHLRYFASFHKVQHPLESIS